ncbi:NADAR family protein [Yinghuangia sp. ASG 101]|uniref:NADAR family protein n=1 Tax=Yinghuangia sp. ASG 101 TaxID=2896848 RepID=UPI001E321624|nr:NADAR family protein [Yinghuangia sp. ASG 101]UGQ09866.1 NADAR family protein [Yinghuangia sp. ASG 101]
MDIGADISVEHGGPAGAERDEPRDVAGLLAWAAAGRRLRFLHFWGHAPQADGSLGAGCLSQWWPSPFTVDDVTYATAEHWMMAGKARLFGDPAAERRAVAAPHPKTAKAVGRQVRGFDEATWVARRFELVVAGNVAKFGQNAALRAFLLGTNTRILVEASPMDRLWGIGLAATDPRADDPAQWRGLNLLGFALMETRARLRAEESEHASEA